MKKFIIFFFNLIFVASLLIIGGCSSDGYSIEYNLNGGKFDSPAVYSYTDDSGEITLSEPSRLGYKFVGWIENEGDTPTKSLTFNSSERMDKEFSAVWEKKVYNVKLNLVYQLYYGGERFIVECRYRDSALTSEQGFTVNYGDKIINLADAYTIDSDNFRFVCWMWFNEQGEGKVISSTTVFDENLFGEQTEVVIQAVCESNYTPNA